MFVLFRNLWYNITRGMNTRIRIMCYGSGCKFEDYRGGCRKPHDEICPANLCVCEGENCVEEVEELIECMRLEDKAIMYLCQNCADDEDMYIEVEKLKENQQKLIKGLE